MFKNKFQNTKGVIRRRTSKDKPYNDQQKSDNRKNNDLQEKFEDTKEVIKIEKAVNLKRTTQWPKEKGQKNKQDTKEVIKIEKVVNLKRTTQWPKEKGQKNKQDTKGN